MDLLSPVRNFKPNSLLLLPSNGNALQFPWSYAAFPPRTGRLFSNCSCRFSAGAFRCFSKKKGRDVQPVVKEAVDDVEEEVEEEEEEEEADIVDEYEEFDDEEEEIGDDELDGDILMEGDDNLENEFEDDFEAEFGDGGAGGGICLAGTWWDKKALSLAEEVSSKSFDGDLKIYAFKTSANGKINLRIEKLSNKSGSPNMADIEAFSSAYRAVLDEAELAGTIPTNISLEVSSPGVERVVRIPEDLERFKDRPMYVRYLTDRAAAATPQENDGVFKLVSFDEDLGYCIWGIADVRINREQAGKGRPLSKKQREWRLQTSFDSLCLVRLYSEC